MNEKIAQEILDELFSSLKAVETQTGAILQFLNDRGLAKQEELAPYLERAGEASGVRLRAARARIEYLLSSALKSDQGDARKEPQKTGETAEKSAGQQSDNAGPDESRAHGSEKENTTEETRSAQKPASEGEARAENGDVAAKWEDNREHEESNRDENQRMHGDEDSRDVGTPDQGGCDRTEKAA